MKTKLFIVTTVINSDYDDDLWCSTKVFADKNEAQKYFEEEKRSCYEDAWGVDTRDADDLYDVHILCNTDTKVDYLQDADAPQHYQVRMFEQEIDL